MGKVMLGTLLGFGLLVGSIGLALIIVRNIQAGGSGWPLFISLALFIVGLFVLYKAGRIDPSKPKFKDSSVNPETGKSILEKNNAIISEWNETNVKRDKLKMLEAAGRVEEEKLS